MNYHTIYLMDKKELTVTESELQGILQSPDDLVAINRLGIVINKKSISHTAPQNVSASDQVLERKNHKIGTLHDGRSVIRHFGQWYMADGDFKEDGAPLSRPDPTYYPEVARDCVPSPQEYQLQYASLPLEKRKAAIVGGLEDLKRLQKKSKRFARLGFDGVLKNIKKLKEGK